MAFSREFLKEDEKDCKRQGGGVSTQAREGAGDLGDAHLTSPYLHQRGCARTSARSGEPRKTLVCARLRHLAPRKQAQSLGVATQDGRDVSKMTVKAHASMRDL